MKYVLAALLSMFSFSAFALGDEPIDTAAAPAVRALSESNPKSAALLIKQAENIADAQEQQHGPVVRFAALGMIYFIHECKTADLEAATAQCLERSVAQQRQAVDAYRELRDQATPTVFQVAAAQQAAQVVGQYLALKHEYQDAAVMFQFAKKIGFGENSLVLSRFGRLAIEHPTYVAGKREGIAMLQRAAEMGDEAAKKALQLSAKSM